MTICKMILKLHYRILLTSCVYFTVIVLCDCRRSSSRSLSLGTKTTCSIEGGEAIFNCRPLKNGEADHLIRVPRNIQFSNGYLVNSNQTKIALQDPSRWRRSWNFPRAQNMEEYESYEDSYEDPGPILLECQVIEIKPTQNTPKPRIAKPETTTETAKPIPKDNGADDSRIVKIYYRFFFRPKPYHVAIRLCQREGGRLAMPVTAKQAETMKNLHIQHVGVLHHNFKDLQFLGADDMQVEGRWVTLSGLEVLKLGFVKWAPGQPDNAHRRGENCLAMDRLGQFSDVPCWKPLPYTCEFNKL